MKKRNKSSKKDCKAEKVSREKYILIKLEYY